MAALNLRSATKWAALACLLSATLWAAPRAWRGIEFNAALRGARESLRAGRVSEAFDTLTRLESLRPENAELSYLLGVCHRRQAVTSKARVNLKRAGELGWSRTDVIRQEAMCDSQAGERAAESFLLETLKAGCDDDTAADIYESLVKGYLAGLYMREASLCLDFWLQWRPNDLLPHELKAELLHAVNDTGREIEEYRTLLRLDPKNLDARLKYGEMLLEQRATAEALEEFRHCQELDPTDPGIKLDIAACERNLGDLADAERDLRALIDAEELTSSQRAFARVELGQVALAKRSFEEAVDCFERALRDSPADRTAHYALGLALQRLGRTEDANAQIERSTKIDEQNERLSDLMHQIIRQPEDADSRCEAGEILLDQENEQEAYLWLLSALRCDKTHQRTHEALARYYSKIGKPEAAERHLAWAAGSAPAATSAAPSVIAPGP